MSRTLFFQEFKRSFVQAALLTFPIFFALLFIERFALSRPDLRAGLSEVFSGTPDAVIDALLIALIVCSGFAFGIGTFFRLNDRHITFIQSLPIPRVQIWTILVVANVTSLMVVMTAVLLLRPSLWSRTDALSLSDKWPFIVGIHVVLFAAGSCFVMLFRRIAMTAVIGGILTAAGFEVLHVFAAAPSAPLNSPRLYGIPVSNVDPGNWLLASLVFAVMYFGLSLTFFAGGELNLLRARIRNWVILTAGIFAYAFVMAIGIEAGALSHSALNFDYREIAVSNDGKYVALLERREGAPLFTKLHIIDVENAKETGTYTSYGVVRFAWSKSKPILNVLAVESPLRRLSYLLPASDFLVQLSPQAGVLHKVRFLFSQITDSALAVDGSLLVSVARGNEVRLLRVSDEGTVSEIFKAPMKTWASIQPAGLMTFLSTYAESVSPTAELTTTVWNIESHNEPVRWSPLEARRDAPNYLIDGQLFSRLVAEKELRRRVPVGSRSIVYLLSGSLGQRSLSWPLGRPFDVFGYSADRFIKPIDLKSVFGLEPDNETGTGRVLMFDSGGEWRVLGETIPLTGVQKRVREGVIRSGVIDFAAFARGICANDVEGLAVFHETRGSERSTYLYDARLDRKLLVGTTAAGNAPMFCQSISKVPGSTGSLILFAGPNWFLYESGELTRITAPPGFYAYLARDGTQIVQTRDEVVYYSKDGQQRRLWPAR